MEGNSSNSDNSGMIITKKFRVFENFITLTFGNRAENHIGNECFGFNLDKGFGLEDFEKVKEWGGEKVKIYNLNDLLGEEDKEKKEKLYNEDKKKECDKDGYLLVIEGGIDLLCGNGVKDKLYDELNDKEVDKKFWNNRTSKVLNKRARWNYCIGDFERLEPNYEKGEGRVYNFENLENTKNMREKLGELLGEKGSNLMGEINKYYDPKNCGIGFHGDKEREIVIGCRLGKSMPIVFQWYYNSERKGEKFVLNLKHGDIYIMSDKTVGRDWMRKSIYTLRHAAGSDKYIK